MTRHFLDISAVDAADLRTMVDDSIAMKKQTKETGSPRPLEGKVLAISGDTVPCEGLLRLAREADLLIQCCHLPQRLVNDVATRYLTADILPSSGQVGQIAARAQVQRMALTHLSASINEVTYPEILADIAREYGGEVIPGEDLMVIEV